MTTQRRVICLVIDRLGAGALGPYGNTWIDTRGLSHLAVDSLLLDFATIDTPDLAQLYTSYLTGTHAACSDRDKLSIETLPDALHKAGVQTHLLTDDLSVAAHPLANDFARADVLALGAAEQAEELEQTQFARFFTAASEQLQAEGLPGLLWLHSLGMNGPWDAPQRFRAQFADPDDPQPPAGADVPNMQLANNYDPDELLGIMHAYAGQVAALDACFAVFYQAFCQSELADSTLLVVLGARGFPLGEHRRVGAAGAPGECDALHEELTHVPWIMRYPGTKLAGTRSTVIVQPHLVPIMIAEWLGLQGDWAAAVPTTLELVAQQHASMDQALSIAYANANKSMERSFRTPAWYLRLTGDDSRPELFVKPDDRWEVNEVSGRCPDIVESMTRALGQFEKSCNRGRPATEPLPEELVRHAGQ